MIGTRVMSNQEARVVTMALVSGNQSKDSSIRAAGSSSEDTIDEVVGEGSSDCPFELPSDGCDLDGVVKGLIEQALARESGNQSAAARLLGVSRYTLRYRMEKYGLR